MAKYNVLTECWIPVKDMDGDVRKVSLTDAILDAHKYRELSETDSIVECALYRFLFTFVSDMIELFNDGNEDIADIISVLQSNGSFDRELFDKYINRCEHDGTSFDLFDPTRPFMQNGNVDENRLPVTKIDPRTASCSQKLFYTHTLDTESKMPYDEAVKHLLSQLTVCPPAGRGYGTSHLGYNPPVFVFVLGNNLFETIIFNLMGNEGNDREWNCPFWRMDLSKVEKGADSPPFSTIAGMFFPWRSTKLLDPEDGLVHNIYHISGFKFSGNREELTTDPHVCYVDDKGRLLRAISSDNAWKSMVCLFDYSPLVVSRYKELMWGDDNIRVMTYSAIISSRGVYQDAWKSVVSFPSNIADPSSGMQDRLKTAVDAVNEMQSNLKYAYSRAFNGGKTISSSILTQFNYSCRDLFFSEFLSSIEEDDSLVKWEESIRMVAVKLFVENVIDTQRSMAAICRAYDAKGLLYRSVCKK